MRKRNRIFLTWAAMGLLLFSLPACVEEDDFDFDKLSDNVDWTPNMIVPAGYGSFTIWYLLNQHEANPEDATITLDEKGLLHIKHIEKDIFSYSASEVLSFPAQSTENLGLAVPSGIIGTTPPANNKINFGIADKFSLSTDDTNIILTELTLSTSINFTIVNPLSEEVTLSITLPDGKINGNVVNKTITVAPQTTTIDTWTLNDLTFLFDTPSTANELSIDFQAEIITSGNPISTNGGNNIDISYQVQNIDFQLAKGDFGQQTIDIGSGNLDMGVDFWDDIEGSFKFADPKINLTFYNGVGVPFDINADLTGYNTDGNSVALNPQPLQPDYPRTEAQIDATVESTVTYNKDNSNIVDLMALPPSDRIEYSGNVVLNPDPVDLSQPNIIKNTSSIAVDMEIDVPLDFSATNLVFQDTITDLDISDSDKVKFGKLVIVTKNGLPLDVKVDKIYLTDVYYNKLDSVSDAQVFEAAAVFTEGPNIGMVDPSKIIEQDHEIDFSESVIAKLNQTKNIIIKANVSTTNNGGVPVKLQKDDKLEFKLAVQAMVDLND